MDGVDPPTGATILARRAARSRLRLWRRVGDHVPLTGTTALEDVVEAEPVAHLVRERPPLAEVRRRATREAGVEDDDAVVLRSALVVGREGRVPEETAPGPGLEPDGVDVQRGHVPFPKLVLHVRLGLFVGANTAEPCCIRGAGRLAQGEADAAGTVYERRGELLSFGGEFSRTR